MNIETVDITPNWETALTLWVEVLMQTTNEGVKQDARKEIIRAGKILDAQLAAARELL